MTNAPSDLPDDGGDDEEDAETSSLPRATLYMTPTGFAALQAELRWLMKTERPRIVEIVSWAAGNGDRSENGDYLYNKKRLREIDRRMRFLTKRIENAEVVDPKRQQHLERVYFGATVTYLDQAAGTQTTIKLVGVDEANLDEGKINWLSPVAQALLKAEIGDIVKLRAQAGGPVTLLEVIDLNYEIPQE
jgi:transcription elongation factor GreB